MKRIIDSAPVPSAAAIPFNDLGRGVAELRHELDAALARVLSSGWFVLGREGKAFEEEFAAAAGAAHAVGVGSGTDAIELALRALGLGPGDEVVTQANTCVPTVAAIERTGATPVLADVEAEGGTMDVKSLHGALGEKTRAVVPVHLYGQCADVEAIVELCGPRDRGRGGLRAGRRRRSSGTARGNDRQARLLQLLPDEESRRAR